MFSKNMLTLVITAVILALTRSLTAQTTTEFQTDFNTEPIENATISTTLSLKFNETGPMETMASLVDETTPENLIELAPAETRVPVKYVSSAYSNGKNQGYSKKTNAKDDGGYDHRSIHTEKDKDSYGFAAEAGYGKYVNGETGENPSIKDQHSYRAISKLGNNWKKQDEEKSADLLATEPKESRRSEKIQKTPEKARGSKKYQSTFADVDKEIARLASLVDAADPIEDSAESSEKKPMKKVSKNKRLKKVKKSAKIQKPKNQQKRGTGTSTGYGNGFDTPLSTFHRSKFNDRGPVLFNSKLRSGKYTKTPTTTISHSIEEHSEETPKKRTKKSKKGKSKGNKKSGKKNARLTIYDGLENNYGSYEHDGYGADEHYDSGFYGGASTAASGEEKENNDYDEEGLEENDYDEEGVEENDYEVEEASNDGDSEDEETNDGEDEEETESNDYDYEENDYDEDAEGEHSQPKKYTL